MAQNVHCVTVTFLFSFFSVVYLSINSSLCHQMSSLLLSFHSTYTPALDQPFTNSASTHSPLSYWTISSSGVFPVFKIFSEWTHTNPTWLSVNLFVNSGFLDAVSFWILSLCSCYWPGVGSVLVSLPGFHSKPFLFSINYFKLHVSLCVHILHISHINVRQV